MSNQDLGNVLSQLPEYFQKRAIISSLNMMLSTGELDMANKLVEDISHIQVRDDFKAKAISIGVAVAVRSRNYQLASKRYAGITALNKSEEIVNYMADALFHLSDLLLPDEPSKLAELWQNAISDKMPFHAQTIFAQLGLMLCRQFYKNRDCKAANRITKSMKVHLNSDFCGNIFRKLKELEGKNTSC